MHLPSSSNDDVWLHPCPDWTGARVTGSDLILLIIYLIHRSAVGSFASETAPLGVGFPRLPAEHLLPSSVMV